MMFRRLTLVIAAALTAAVLGWGSMAAQAPPSKTVWAGVYTNAQAERGAAAYKESCERCHRTDLDPQNDDARMIGPVFMERWREYDLGALFDLLKATMPRGAVGSLSDPTYTDIMATLLRANGFPSGRAELRHAELPDVLLQLKEGPKPLPNGALAQMVGCFERVPGGWALKYASEPARTARSRGSTSKEMAAAEIRPLGSLEFLLQSLDFIIKIEGFVPDDHEGQRMQAKGYIVRQPRRERLDLTSLEVLGDGCR